jgi:23S rRNA (uracil1939-C5)-methyltransferase
VTGETPPRSVRLRRDVRSFFQGNRFLLEPLVRHVVALVPPGPAVDLYAGVGLFGLSLAATGAPAVTLVEGDAVSSADLLRNAEPFADRLTVRRSSVEEWLAAHGAAGASAGATFIIDPPRTGLSRDAVAGIVRHQPRRVIYVSCDVATLARDVRALADNGYELAGLAGFDLFPNTAHVETVAVLSRN